MKHKKRVTKAVLEANQANSKSSTGPTTKEGKARSSRNALRHGILARKITFEDKAHRRAYRAIRKSWKKQFNPHGRLERFLVEEIALISWKLGIVEALEVEDLLRRENAPVGIQKVFHNFDLKLPVSHSDLPLDRVWDCERVVVHGVTGEDSSSAHTLRVPAVVQNRALSGTQSSRSSNNHGNSHLEIQAVMGSTLQTVSRYRSMLKRDLYHALQELRNVQSARQKTENLDGKPWAPVP